VVVEEGVSLYTTVEDVGVIPTPGLAAKVVNLSLYI
jgi:hypothetical protein